MQIRPEIDGKYKEMEIHVCNDRMNEEVGETVLLLHSFFDPAITGIDEVGNHCVIRPADIISFYAEGQRVIAMDASKRYSVSKKLYEIEKEYEGLHFVRISKSEIVNYKKIKSLDMSLTGTIKVTMKNGYETYSSRRNVAKLKELLLQNRQA